LKSPNSENLQEKLSNPSASALRLLQAISPLNERQVRQYNLVGGTDWILRVFPKWKDRVFKQCAQFSFPKVRPWKWRSKDRLRPGRRKENRDFRQRHTSFGFFQKFQNFI